MATADDSARLTNVVALAADSPGPSKGKKAETTVPLSSAAVSGSKTIIIEHCKQCISFKTRAFQVQYELEKSVPGVNVLVNPEKPRKGCFEIREKGEGGEVFVSLLGMKRPFPQLKELDVEGLIFEIILKIRS